ncbi:MAG: ketoacyl-ACP synthase III [Bacteroidia bacterium]|nr:ketoacyl-ACP synthase III [Bacteroidia bacterium]
MTKAKITAVAGYVPDDVLSNFDLEKMVDTTNEWILTRTGIKERRILRDISQANSDMALKAAQELLAKRKISAEEIDCVIYATVTPDHVFPATANIFAAKLGAKNAWGFDISAACSGFLYALGIGAQFIETGKYKKVLVVGSDVMSRIIDYTDRTTCIIFGDGCGMFLLEPTEENYGIMDFIFYSDGNGCKHLHMKAGGSFMPPSYETVANRYHYVYQEGQAVFKQAVYNMAEVSAQIMEKNNLKSEDIAWLVAHQANKRIIDATAQRMGLSSDKVMMNIEKYGNTTAGTIPLLIWEYEPLLKKGDNLILSTFGGGFTWGAMWVKWG